MESKPPVAVVFHHIGPYHRARLNAAADRLPVTGFEWSAKAYWPALLLEVALLSGHDLEQFREASRTISGALWAGSFWRGVGACSKDGDQGQAKEIWSNRSSVVTRRGNSSAMNTVCL